MKADGPVLNLVERETPAEQLLKVIKRLFSQQFCTPPFKTFERQKLKKGSCFGKMFKTTPQKGSNSLTLSLYLHHLKKH